MAASDTALLVIDAQESFRHRPYFADVDVPTFVGRLQALHDGAKSAGMPVLQIFHIMDSGPFAESSGLVTTLAPLRIEPDAIFHKRRHSALVGSGLDIWLTANGIRRLIVSGIRRDHDAPRFRSRLHGRLRRRSDADFPDDGRNGT